MILVLEGVNISTLHATILSFSIQNSTLWQGKIIAKDFIAVKIVSFDSPTNFLYNSR